VSESSAYALLTSTRKLVADSSDHDVQDGATGDVGTASYVFRDKVIFVKGSVFVVVEAAPGKLASGDIRLEFARALAQKLSRGEGEIPVLVRHLPDDQFVRQAQYFVSLNKLKRELKQPVFDSVSFEGGAEAAVANYGTAQLAMIEFTTPQLAGDNDRRITAKIEELRNQSQPVPTAYRRVGNYSVFIFIGQTEQVANQLIDQIKYEQVVQWLGDNPYWFQKAQREYTETTLGVFIAVVKASGLALLSCLAAGSFFGALLFSRRRSQQHELEAFSDAGGMLRLNLDEMTPQTDPTRLLGPGR